MDRVIWKHVITHPETAIPLGPDDRILTAATQHGAPCVWVEHSTSPPTYPDGAPTRIIRAAAALAAGRSRVTSTSAPAMTWPGRGWSSTSTSPRRADPPGSPR